MGPQETVRFGEGDATDIESNDNQEGVANNSGSADEAREGATTNAAIPTPYTTSMEDDPGTGIDSRGYGRATLLECLNRFGGQLNLPSLLPTCASGESNEGNLSETDLRQVTSPL